MCSLCMLGDINDVVQKSGITTLNQMNLFLKIGLVGRTTTTMLAEPNKTSSKEAKSVVNTIKRLVDLDLVTMAPGTRNHPAIVELTDRGKQLVVDVMVCIKSPLSVHG